MHRHSFPWEKRGIGYKDMSPPAQAETPDLSVAALSRMLYFVPVENAEKAPVTKKEPNHEKITVFCNLRRCSCSSVRLFFNQRAGTGIQTGPDTGTCCAGTGARSSINSAAGNAENGCRNT
jgi:hypothetical protein